MKKFLQDHFNSLLLAVVASAFYCLMSAPAQQPSQTVFYNGNAVGTSVKVTLTGASQIITLNGNSSQITVSFPSGGSSELFFNPFGTTCTTSNYPVEAGTAYTFQGLPQVKQFSVYGTGSVGVLAH